MRDLNSLMFYIVVGRTISSLESFRIAVQTVRKVTSFSISLRDCRRFPSASLAPQGCKTFNLRDPDMMSVKSALWFLSDQPLMRDYTNQKSAGM